MTKTMTKQISNGVNIVAKLRHLRMSPRKVRLVANLIKNMDVNEAKAQLKFMPKKAGGFLLKLLNSATANAKHNFNLKEDNLYISKVLVDPGPSLKRWMPRAMGRAVRYLKRTSHITLVLNERVEGPVKGKRVPTKLLESKKEEKQFEEGDKKVGEPEAIKKSIVEEKITESKTKQPISPNRPFGASGAAKKRHFSRQTFGNFKKGIKRLFRRKSV